MKNNKITVVIPSYNEVESIAILIKGIGENLPQSKIIIVDDSSREENNKLKKIIKGKRGIALISRLNKGGRGSAILDGFREALKDKEAEYFFEMDSDLAHDPKEMERFTKKMDSGNLDLIIGSRYLPGGRIINIAPNRTIMSKVINKFLYYWLGIHLSDHTSGFRLYSKKAVKFLLKTEIKSKGFITLSETAYKLYLNNFKIGEVPITWNFRKYGKSNVNIHELFSSLIFVLSMKKGLKIFPSKKTKLWIIICALFIFSFSLRAWNLNKMGRTWDEAAYVEVGYKFVKLIEKGDFLNQYFYQWTDEPSLTRYIYGLSGSLDRSAYGNKIAFNYDYTYSHLVSAAISSAAVIIVALFCFEFISTTVGILSGIILAMLPLFLGFSQIATLESMQFFTFTASVYLFIRFLKNNIYKRAIAAGLILGLAFLSKFTNILLLPLFILIFLLWNKYAVIKKINGLSKKMITILLTAMLTFFVFWPISLANPIKVILSIYTLRSGLGRYPSIEVFFGRLMHVPIFYYFVFFIITTPIIILILFFIGAKYISDFGRTFKNLRKNEQTNLKWIYYSLIVWFCLPFIQSFYNFRHHGLRFIIEIYAPLSIIAAIGLVYLANIFSKKRIYKAIIFIGVFLYLLLIIFRTTPYYLDYFNEVVGGVATVYEKGLFQIGWWGQGLREAGYYLEDNAKKNSTIALFISPIHVFPPIKNQNLIFIDSNKGIYNPKIKYDYVVVNYFHVLRERFDDSGIKNDYKLMHQVKVDGASLVDIYSKK